MKRSNSKRCKQCYFFAPYYNAQDIRYSFDSVDGECLRYPRSAKTSEYRWCGEWHDKNEEEN